MNRTIKQRRAIADTLDRLDNREAEPWGDDPSIQRYPRTLREAGIQPREFVSHAPQPTRRQIAIDAAMWTIGVIALLAVILLALHLEVA